MTMRRSLYTAPTAEPIHLTEAKLHLRLAVDAAAAVLYTAEDGDISGWITTARETAEIEQWRALVLQVWDLWLDEWPAGDEIEIPLPPLRAVEFIKYTDTAGTVTTLASTEYEVDTDSTIGRIVLGYGKSWPSSDLAPKNPIQIRFRCGYAVPFTATAATDVLVAPNHPFVDGDKVRLSVSGGTLPTGLSLMKDYFVRDAVAGVSLKLAEAAGGVAVDLTAAGTGNMFIGVIPAATITGMRLVLNDQYEHRGDVVMGAGLQVATLPRAAAHFFSMDSVKGF